MTMGGDDDGQDGIDKERRVRDKGTTGSMTRAGPRGPGPDPAPWASPGPTATAKRKRRHARQIPDKVLDPDPGLGTRPDDDDDNTGSLDDGKLTSWLGCLTWGRPDPRRRQIRGQAGRVREARNARQTKRQTANARRQTKRQNGKLDKDKRQSWTRQNEYGEDRRRKSRKKGPEARRVLGSPGRAW